ncbi:MAG: hypothetical protein LBO02_01585 [Holosporaceae bacterium]|nr:hypothetical protein [Holosporaceae bacterium]
MSKDKPQKSAEVTESAKTAKCRCQTSTWTVALLAVLVVGLWFFHQNRKEASNLAASDGINAAVLKMEKQIELLQNDVANLNQKLEFKSATESVKQCLDKRGELRQKWKAWMALRAKMESNEPFEAELNKFNELFSCDKDIVRLVEDLAQGVETVTNGNDNKIVGAYKNILRKIVKFKKINHQKLVEISGYVLSSICDCNRE